MLIQNLFSLHVIIELILLSYRDYFQASKLSCPSVVMITLAFCKIKLSILSMITATVGYEGYENLYHNFVEFHTDMEYLLKRDRWSTLISSFPFFFKK